MPFDADYGDGHVSRSRKKRDSTAAQKLGTALAALPKADLETLFLPAPLLDAILDWKKFPGHEAKRRQMQYIGKLMREADIDAIERALAMHLAPGRAETKARHEIEALRDALINAEGIALEHELAMLTARYAEAPVSRLRHLVAMAKNERTGKKPPKAYRELFRLLKALAAGDGK